MEAALKNIKVYDGIEDKNIVHYLENAMDLLEDEFPTLLDAETSAEDLHLFMEDCKEELRRKKVNEVFLTDL